LDPKPPLIPNVNVTTHLYGEALQGPEVKSGKMDMDVFLRYLKIINFKRSQSICL
jgi:hypothetical protein